MEPTRETRGSHRRSAVWFRCFRVLTLVLVLFLATFAVLAVRTDFLQKAAWYFAVQAADREGVQLSAGTISGGIHTPLEVTHLFAANAEGTLFSAGAVEISFSWNALLRGREGILRAVRLESVHVVLHPRAQSRTATNGTPARSVMNALDHVAAWIPEAVEVRNSALDWHGPDGHEIRMRGINASVMNLKLGDINIKETKIINRDGERIELPPMRGKIIMAGREVEIAGWDFGGRLSIDSASLDLEDFSAGLIRSRIRWTGFGGGGEARLLRKNDRWWTWLALTGTDLREVAAMMPGVLPAGGVARQVTVEFEGDPEHLESASFFVKADWSGLEWKGMPIGDIQVLASAKNGTLHNASMQWDAITLQGNGRVSGGLPDWQQWPIELKVKSTDQSLARLLPFSAGVGMNPGPWDARITAHGAADWDHAGWSLKGSSRADSITNQEAPMGSVTTLFVIAGDWDGKLQLLLESFEWEHPQGRVEVKGRASWTPDSFPTADLSILAAGGGMEFRARTTLDPGCLVLEQIAAEMDGKMLLSGQAFIPLLETRSQPGLAGWIAPGEEITASFHAQDLQWAVLAAPFGISPSFDGILNASISIDGLLGDPVISVEMEIRDFLWHSSDFPMEAVSGSLHANHEEGILTMDGRFNYPGAGPVRLSARTTIPVDPLHWRQMPPAFRELPLDVSIQLEKTPLGVISSIFPAIAATAGNLEADITLKGTLAEPDWTGFLQVDAVEISPIENYPSITNIHIGIELAGSTATLRDTRAVIASAPVRVAGEADLSDPANIVLNLEVVGSKLPVVRNENLRLRADISLLVTGPLSEAEVSGEVFLVDGLYMRNVSFNPLQIAIGGEGERRQRPIRSIPPPFSVQEAPFANWSFDVAVRNATPFRIRSNFIQATVEPDLHLLGPAREPYWSGVVGFKDARIVLPFSRATIERGTLAFDQDQPRLPVLDLHARSTVRGYQIDAYISGRITHPDIALSSSPPLPAEEIALLLTTGLTPDELAGDEAGRTAVGRGGLLLLRSVFRDDDPFNEEDFFDRVRLNILPPQKGGTFEVIETSLDLNDRWLLTGERDTWGFFNGGMEYRIRFR